MCSPILRTGRSEPFRIVSFCFQPCSTNAKSSVPGPLVMIKIFESSNHRRSFCCQISTMAGTRHSECPGRGVESRSLGVAVQFPRPLGPLAPQTLTVLSWGRRGSPAAWPRRPSSPRASPLWHVFGRNFPRRGFGWTHLSGRFLRFVYTWSPVLCCTFRVCIRMFGDFLVPENFGFHAFRRSSPCKPVHERIFDLTSSSSWFLLKC